MNPRFLLAPVAAFAILTFAAPVNAQSDPNAEFGVLRRDAQHFHTDLKRFERVADRCQPVDTAEAVRLAETANDIARRAAGLAPQLATTKHVSAMNMQALAEADYLWIVNHGFVQPEKCYVPPAE